MTTRRIAQNFSFGLVFALAVMATASPADTFGSGENSFDIPFVTIGSPGNVADTTGAPNPAGSVPYTYRIGKYEVPEEAVRKANAASELAGDPLGITLDDRGPQKPATGLSWFEAARFVNWLNEEKGFQPAYKFDDSNQFQLWEPSDPGYNANNLFRNSLARYVLPDADEWYKAAFYDPVVSDYWDYPTGSDEPPIAVASGTEPDKAVFQQEGPADVMLAGGKSPFATVGQGGNVVEWHETALDLVNDMTEERRRVRGGSAFQGVEALSVTGGASATPAANPLNVGLRIVGQVPEPSTVTLLVAAVMLLQIVTHTRSQSILSSLSSDTIV